MMNKYFSILTLFTFLFLYSCGNSVEEIKDPSTGKLLKRYEYFTDDEGQKIKDGSYIEWNESGEKVKELQYKNDSLEGVCKFFKPGGSRSEVSFINGKKDGAAIYYDRNNRILSKENYKNDLFDGKQYYYQSDAKPESVLNYKNGKPDGNWIFYDPKGKQQFKLKFIDGICQNLIGQWKFDERYAFLNCQSDGIYQYSYPYFRMSTDVKLQSSGRFEFNGRRFKLADKSGQFYYEFEWIFVEKDMLSLLDINTERFEDKIAIVRRI